MRRATLATLVCSAALLIGATVLLPRVAIEPDLTKMLPAQHRLVRLAELLDRRGESRRALFVVLRGPIDDATLGGLVEDLRRSPLLAEVAATREELLGAAWRERVAAPLWFLPEPRLTELTRVLSPEGRRAALRDTLALLAEDPLGGAEIARRDPLGLRWLTAGALEKGMPFALRRGTPYVVLEDGERALLRLVGTTTSLDASFAVRLLADVEARLARVPWQSEMYGGYVVARADAARIRADLIGSVIGSSLLVFFYLWFSLRSLFVSLCSVLPVGLAAYCAIAVAGSVFGPLTPVAIAAAAVLLGLGVDFSIHYLVHYADHRSAHPHAQAASLTRRSVGAPLVVGMTTTVVAFLSLAFGRFQGLAGFGMVLAIGMVLALLATLFVLPLLLGVVRQPVPRPRNSAIAGALQRLSAGSRGRRVAAAVCAVAVVACVVVATRGVTVRVDPEHLRPAADPVGELRQRLERELGFSLVPVLLLVPATSASPQVAALLTQLRAERWLAFDLEGRADPEQRARRVAEFHRATAGWFDGTLRDLGELGFAATPFRPALEQLRDRLAAPAPVAVPRPRVELGGRQLEAVLCYPAPATLAADRWPAFVARVAELGGRELAVFGTPTLLAGLREVLAGDLLQASLVTAVLAFLLVLAMARSLRAGLLALLPVTCGLAITLAVLVGFGVPLSLGNFVAIPFLLGIGIDDGVHLVARLRRPDDGGLDRTAVAVVRTSVTTVLGFGSLVLSRSPGLASLGWIAVLGVTCCLMTSLLVVPALWSTWLCRGSDAR